LFIAEPSWIKRTVIVAIAFAAPSMLLLLKVWRNRSAKPDITPKMPFAIKTGIVFLITYVAWFLNVTFEKSVMFMVAWPLFGILLAILGCVLSLMIKGDDRKMLFIANALLLILALASIIAPN
jgi:hypothetical protein